LVSLFGRNQEVRTGDALSLVPPAGGTVTGQAFNATSADTRPVHLPLVVVGLMHGWIRLVAISFAIAHVF
jgi:hypothetical protein